MSRVRGFLRRPREEILAWAVCSRLVVFAAVLIAGRLRWPKGFFGPEFEQGLGFLVSWDAGWYRTVAAHGYLLVPGQQSDPAFFPLFPMVLRGLHSIGLAYDTAGLLLANVAFLIGVVAFYELGRELLPEHQARRAAIYAAIFPMGFVFSMAYPESIVFAAVALSALLGYRRRWTAAAAVASVGALARPEGVFYVLPLGALVLRWWPELKRPERGRALGAVIAPGAAALAYPIYLAWSLHNVHAWNWAQRGWGRSFKPTGLITAIVQLPADLQLHPWLVRDVIFALLYILLLALAWRAGIPRAWIVAGILIVALPLFSGRFTSDARFGLLALPVYWALAVLDRWPLVRAALPACCLILLAAGAVTLPLAFP